MRRNLGDWVIALTVIACSVVLFIALALALSRKTFGRPDRTITVTFEDLTGISVGSQVKYGGALAGSVVAVNMLGPNERRSSADPRNTVQAKLALFSNVPILTEGTRASIAADTLLSDKFVLISPGLASAAPLPEEAILQGIAPATFDGILRDLNRFLANMNGLFDSTDAGPEGIFHDLRGLMQEARSIVAQVNTLIGEAQSVLPDAKSLIADAHTVVGDASSLVEDVRMLLSENREGIKKLIAKLDQASSSLNDVATRADNLMKRNSAKIDSSLADLRVIAENLRVTSVYARILTRSLAERPQQIIWGPGRRRAPIPPEEQIRRSRTPASGR